MRSFLQLGAPLRSFSSALDRKSEQTQIVSIMAGNITDFLHEQNEIVTGILYSEPAESHEITELIFQDATWAALSVGLVFICLIIHLRSLFLGFVSILCILMTFPTTAVIVQGICQISYYS